MTLFVPKETHQGETRTAVTPATAKKLSSLGVELEVESGVGATIQATDKDYESAGAKVVSDRTDALKRADIILRLRKPDVEEVALLKKGALHVSYLDPFNEQDLVDKLAAANVTSVSMEMMPRTTLAQKMDSLSSQANLAGYVAVLLAAERLDKILPMMMTPSGTISPARVFIIGVGVAGLQAIATAKRLGARVDAFDTRPVVEEQVKSLGAKFVKIDLGETGQTDQGYAKALTPEQLEMQREGMKKVCAQSDIVITTAQLFGRKAPVIVTKDMVEAMKPGSVLVDLAVETGGNVEGSVVNEEVDVNGVKIMGIGNLPGRVALNASEMYASNVTNFVEHFWDKEAKTFKFDMEDEILQGSVITHEGKMVNQRVKDILSN